MKSKGREMVWNIIFMQKRIRGNFCIAKAKTEVLVNYWDKMYGLLQTRASKLKDKEANDLCLNILKVPQEV